MDVSVIFATYNRSDVLEDVLNRWREVQKATKYDFEIICSDDASTDNTVDILRRASDLPITIIENEKGGAGPARNAALEIAKGKIVIFTGDDMFPNPEFVNQHFENHLKFGDNVATLGRIDWHKDIKLNHLMYHITDIGCEQFGFIGLPVYQLIDFRHFYTSNISVSKTMLDSVSVHFRTDFDKYGFEDIEFGYRLQKMGMKIYYDPSIVIEHHHVYSSVEKFCTRQQTSGEELVVFNDMHSDLEDKCICDVENCKRSFVIFSSKKKHKWSVSGFFMYLFLYFARKATCIGEKILSAHSCKLLEQLCSVIYAGLFQFYFFYGCAARIANGTHVKKSFLTEFTFRYLNKNFAQLYWNTGYGFNESESRKWMIWDRNYIVLESRLPKGVKEVRFTPLKNKCIAWIKEISFLTEDGRKLPAKPYWYNYCYSDGCKYDFTNTVDPQIVFRDINPGCKKLLIEMSVKDMRTHKAYYAVRRSLGKIYHKLVARKNSGKNVEIKYAYGQPRKIQIGIDTTVNETEKLKLIEIYQKQVSMFDSAIIFSPLSHMQRGYCDYIYSPQKKPLDRVQMLQVAYTLLSSNYDYVLASKSYDIFPEIGAECIEDVFVYSALLSGNSVAEKIRFSQGRYIRLPSFDIEKGLLDVSETFSGSRLWDRHYLSGTNMKKPEFLISPRNYTYHKEKPVVFVLPIFLAVGGVERNTIETMRSLKDYYDFCMITMEYHVPEQGSLHYQLQGLCDYVFDLKEITDFKNYFTVLYELKKIFSPDVIWLCNNSPWLEDHFGEFRNLFSDSRIVAQDVYDTQVGWIEYYGSGDIIKCDRFIAITELIKETFIKNYHISEDKIDVIYPVVDAEHIREERRNNMSRQELCLKYGVASDKRLFSTVGRITAQKNPLRYLKMVEEIADKYKDIQFVMVGEGNLDSEVEKFISSHGMKDKIVRVPYISNAPEFIKILDGLVILSDYEGMPIVSIEAMSFGVPVFSTDVGDLKRFLLKNENGMILNPRLSDADNFAQFHENYSLYKYNAEKCADEILHFFSADYQSDQYRKCFEE